VVDVFLIILEINAHATSVISIGAFEVVIAQLSKVTQGDFRSYSFFAARSTENPHVAEHARLAVEGGA
jgi:hypothetical protein